MKLFDLERVGPTFLSAPGPFLPNGSGEHPAWIVCGNDQFQRSGKNGYLRGSAAGRVAVALDRNRHTRLDLHSPKAADTDVGQPFVLPECNLI